MNRTFNELKRDVLHVLARNKGRLETATSKSLAMQLDIKLTNSCDCLLRLRKQGLVNREPISKGRRGRPKYVYCINSRGKKRLRFWHKKKKDLLPS